MYDAIGIIILYYTRGNWGTKRQHNFPKSQNKDTVGVKVDRKPPSTGRKHYHSLSWFASSFVRPLFPTCFLLTGLGPDHMNKASRSSEKAVYSPRPVCLSNRGASVAHVGWPSAGWSELSSSLHPETLPHLAFHLRVTDPLHPFLRYDN